MEGPGRPLISGIVGTWVDVAAAGTANGAAVQLHACNGTDAQRWTAGSDGTLRALGKCLDVTSGSAATGGKVHLWDCNGSGAQIWPARGNGPPRSTPGQHVPRRDR